MPQPVRPGPLSDMVLRAQQAGLSYQRMADRSVGSDGEPGMSKPYFQRLATGGVANAPQADELAAIARGIGEPLRLVQEAAAKQWLGFEATEVAGYDADTRRILVHVEGMDPLERKRLRAMLDAAQEVERLNEPN